MSTLSTHKSKNKYDPLRKWGLAPAEESGIGSTYVVSGHVVSGSSADPRTMYMSEMIGREGQAKAKRILNGKDSDKELKALLQRDKEGMKAVMKARQAVRTAQVPKNEKASKSSSSSSSAKNPTAQNRKGKKEEDFEDLDDSNNSGDEKAVKKSAYSATVIKSLGFDPSTKPGQKRAENKGVQDKV